MNGSRRGPKSLPPFFSQTCTDPSLELAFQLGFESLQSPENLAAKLIAKAAVKHRQDPDDVTRYDSLRFSQRMRLSSEGRQSHERDPNRAGIRSGHPDRGRALSTDERRCRRLPARNGLGREPCPRRRRCRDAQRATLASPGFIALVRDTEGTSLGCAHRNERFFQKVGSLGRSRVENMIT